MSAHERSFGSKEKKMMKELKLLRRMFWNLDLEGHHRAKSQRKLVVRDGTG